MAFMRYAHAGVIKPSITLDCWDEVRQRALSAGPAFDTKVASNSMVLREYHPDQYLLSHCTIIASVDTEANTTAQLGKVMVDGFQVDRRYADWMITPTTSKYVNNNNDAWERKLLLSCFKSFVGGENYVEHIQIPELSKGKIIDAAARDIGDSIYVDILVATDRKHRPLISAITNQQLTTLSMGCQVQFTICSKCGNVAEDETQLCPHIRYMKGNQYTDELGRMRKVAELCGHISAEPGSVKFIEASWVANPAFTGAVLRSILTPAEIQGIGQKVQVAFSEPARTSDPSVLQKAASSHVDVNMILNTWADRNGTVVRKCSVPTHPGPTRIAQFGDDSNPTQGVGDQGAAPAGEAESDPIDKAVESLVGVIRERAIEKLRNEIGQGEAKRISDATENTNEGLVKSALCTPQWRQIHRMVRRAARNDVVANRMLVGLILYKRGGWKSVIASRQFSGRELLALSRFVDGMVRRTALAGESRIYSAVIATGGLGSRHEIPRFLAACQQHMGRDLTESEVRTLIHKGHLYTFGS